VPAAAAMSGSAAPRSCRVGGRVEWRDTRRAPRGASPCGTTPGRRRSPPPRSPPWSPPRSAPSGRRARTGGALTPTGPGR
jgi:hypothetical protein